MMRIVTMSLRGSCIDSYLDFEDTLYVKRSRYCLGFMVFAFQSVLYYSNAWSLAITTNACTEVGVSYSCLCLETLRHKETHVDASPGDRGLHTESLVGAVLNDSRGHFTVTLRKPLGRLVR